MFRFTALNSDLTYSENEVKCGVWTDGKPIYRKTIYFTPTTAFTEFPAPSANIDTLVKLYGMHSQGSNKPRIAMGGYFNENFYSMLGAEPDNRIWARLFSNDGSYLNYLAFITVEYTKTGD